MIAKSSPRVCDGFISFPWLQRPTRPSCIARQAGSQDRVCAGRPTQGRTCRVALTSAARRGRRKKESIYRSLRVWRACFRPERSLVQKMDFPDVRTSAYLCVVTCLHTVVQQCTAVYIYYFYVTIVNNHRRIERATYRLPENKTVPPIHNFATVSFDSCSFSSTAYRQNIQ